MLSPHLTENQINEFAKILVETGLANDQNFAFQRRVNNCLEVTFENAEYVSVALKNDPYDKIYEFLAGKRSYNVKMPDGALIQMMYTFDSNNELKRHRLAFFPSPHFGEFQNNPEIYMNDEIYADVVSRNIVSCPFRFDYTGTDNAHKELSHPKSHLTLGQYKNCRIPVTAPVPPLWFIDFVLRNFYHTAFARNLVTIPRHSGSFGTSILPTEQSIIHVVIPPWQAN